MYGMYVCMYVCMYVTLESGHFVLLELTGVERKRKGNAPVAGPCRGNLPREIFMETIAETGVRPNTVKRSSEIHCMLQLSNILQS